MINNSIQEIEDSIKEKIKELLKDQEKKFNHCDMTKLC